MVWWGLGAVCAVVVVAKLDTSLTAQLRTIPATRASPGQAIVGDAGTLPSGVALAVLGGFRGLAADLQWVRVYGDWARRDLDALRRNLWWVGEIDPRPLTFWLNGARMLAFDVRSWRMARGENANTVSIEQLEEAIAHLERGKRYHVGRAAIDLEIAVLRLNLGNDLEGALAALEQADRCDDAPYFVGRLRGELLERLGRSAEALAWLQELRASLPADDPRALEEVLDLRIVQLEGQMKQSSAEPMPQD